MILAYLPQSSNVSSCISSCATPNHVVFSSSMWSFFCCSSVMLGSRQALIFSASSWFVFSCGMPPAALASSLCVICMSQQMLQSDTLHTLHKLRSSPNVLQARHIRFAGPVALFFRLRTVGPGDLSRPRGRPFEVLVLDTDSRRWISWGWRELPLVEPAVPLTGGWNGRGWILHSQYKNPELDEIDFTYSWASASSMSNKLFSLALSRSIWKSDLILDGGRGRRPCEEIAAPFESKA